MKKLCKMKILLLISLTLALLSCTILQSFAFHDSVSLPIDITIDGKAMLKNGQAQLVNGITYVPLRAFCSELGEIDLLWKEETMTATISTTGLIIVAQSNGQYITVNERPFYSGAKNLLFDGTLYVPVRSIAKAYGLAVEWKSSGDNTLGYVALKSQGKRAEHASDIYDPEVLYWLSRIISAESRGESLLGQIAVGNVVLNRTRNESFPNTVYDVIFDTKFGVQFTPIANGTIYETPAQSSITAAKICLEGYSISNTILYFMNKALSTNMWVSDNRPYVMTLGSHSFYS